MMNKNKDIYSINFTFFLYKEKGNREKFLFQRIARRDMDNTQRVNGIS